MHALRQVLQLPPAFDLDARQKASASVTAHAAARRPHLLGAFFGGPDALGAALSRASLSGAQSAQRAAALLSHPDALSYLTR